MGRGPRRASVGARWDGPAPVFDAGGANSSDNCAQNARPSPVGPALCAQLRGHEQVVARPTPTKLTWSATRTSASVGNVAPAETAQVSRASAVRRKASRRSLRQPGRSVEQSRAQLLQTGVGELHFRLHADDPHDATLRRLLGDVLEQGRLTNACLATQNLHRASSRRQALQLSVQEFALVAAASQQRTPQRAGPRTPSRRKRVTRHKTPPPRLTAACRLAIRPATSRESSPRRRRVSWLAPSGPVACDRVEDGRGVLRRLLLPDEVPGVDDHKAAGGQPLVEESRVGSGTTRS